MATEVPQKEFIQEASSQEELSLNPQRELIQEAKKHDNSSKPASHLSGLQALFKIKRNKRKKATRRPSDKTKVIANPQEQFILARSGKIKGRESRYQKIQRLYPVYMIIATVGVLVSILLAMSIGAVHLPFLDCYQILIDKIFGQSSTDLSPALIAIVWQARLPRILMSAILGAGLALCGVVMQSSIQNPLADPYIIGTSTGAQLGATLVVFLGAVQNVSWASTIGVGTGAFVGAMIASIAVLAIANAGGRMTSVKLVLGGAVLNMVFGSFVSMIFALFPRNEALQNVGFWLTGSLRTINWNSFGFLPIVILLAAIFYLTQTRTMNVMMMGDEAATTLGVDTSRSRLIYMIIAALVIGFIVATCGIIGYVGLIIPHVARGLVGTDHRKMLPFALVTGALFLIWCDVFARTIIINGELSLALVTSVIGAPLLLYRIVKQGFSSSTG